MSSFIGIIETKFAILGTDTLTTYPTKEGDTEIKPRSYSCKSFLLPQFQSTFAVTGILQTGLYFFNYIVENAFGIDIDSLTNIDLQIFRKKLESEYPSFPRGNIYLMGYSNKMECFKSFKLQIKENTKLEWEKIKSNSFIHKPEVKNWEEKISPNEESSYEEIIVNLMKIQKEEDEQRKLVEQVGIGGQIVLNQLGHDKQGRFNIISKIIHEFDDYETLGNQMIQNRNDSK